MIDPGEHRSERMRGLELSLESFKYLNWVNFTEPTGKARKENPKRFQETRRMYDTGANKRDTSGRWSRQP